MSKNKVRRSDPKPEILLPGILLEAVLVLRDLALDPAVNQMDTILSYRCHKASIELAEIRRLLLS